MTGKRIIWLSNAPWCGSGYGEQAGLFLNRLKALGNEVAMFCNFGLYEARTEWNGIPVFPSDGDYGNTALPTYKKVFQADTIIALCDAFVMRPADWPDDMQVAIWAPVDHYPIPPAVLAVLSHEKVTPVAMSRFGERMMGKCNLNPLYVPHAVDTDLFTPRPELRPMVREQLGIPTDAFLVGMVGANKAVEPCRKAFPEAFNAFAQFARTHDDAYMYAHTDPQPRQMGIGLDLVASSVGAPAGRIRFPTEEALHLGVDRQRLAELYQAFDVLLSPSMGEGFGVPIIEAQASGVPVITSDHSAMPELTGAGWVVDGQPKWNEATKAYMIVPFIHSIVAALEKAYETRGDREIREKAREFALAYDADLVTVRYWEPALAALTPPAESRQVRRARERKLAKAAA